MERKELLYLLDVVKMYICQKKEFRHKFIDLLKSVNDEIDN